jgi:hypothetical protein
MVPVEFHTWEWSHQQLEGKRTGRFLVPSYFARTHAQSVGQNPFSRNQSRETVPTVNSELDENIEFSHSSSNLPFGAKPDSSLGRRRSGEFQISNPLPGGDPGIAAPTRCPTSLGEAAETDHSRPTLVCLAIPSLG